MKFLMCLCIHIVLLCVNFGYSMYKFYFCTGRDRWIDYNRRDYDASQVPPEWYTLKAQQFFVYVIYLPSGLARLTDSIGSVVQSGRPHISECKLMDIMAQLTNSITAGIIYHFNRVF